MDVPHSDSLDSSQGDAAPEPALSASNEEEDVDDHEAGHNEAELRPATLCAFVGASQSLDAPVIDLADDCVTLKTPKGDQSIHIDHVQPSSDLTSRELLPSIASEVLSGRNATVLCVDAGGDSASWLLGRDAHHHSDGALAALVGELLTRAPHGMHLLFSALECFQEKLTDLQSQKPVEFADGPHGRSSQVSGLSFRQVSDAGGFGAILAETLAHSRLRSAHKRSHIFFRLEVSADAQRMPPPSPRKPAVPRTPQKKDPTTPRKPSDPPAVPALTVALLAPYDPTQREFLSKEQNDIKRSLFNLGLMIDILNKEITSIGFNWRSFRLTRLLRDTFTQHHQLLLTVHAVASKEQLPAAQWAFHFASSAKRTRRPRKSAAKTLFPATPERPAQATMIATLQHKLQTEAESSNQNAELLKKERARNLELVKKLQQCEEEMQRKDEQLAALTKANERLVAESTAQIASIDRMAQERTQYYERKMAEHERMFLQQNAAFRRLEQRLSGMVHQMREKNFPIVISDRENKSAEEEAEEAELLLNLQAIIRSQVQSISSFIDQAAPPPQP